MPKPTVTSMQLSTGDTIPLSLDAQSGTPIYIQLLGSNLQSITEVQLDSGPDVVWYVTGVSPSASAVYITAYATGSPGDSYLKASARGTPLAQLNYAYFELPLID